MIDALYAFFFWPTVIGLLIMALVVAVRWRPISDGARDWYAGMVCDPDWQNPGYPGMIYLLSPQEWMAQQEWKKEEGGK